MTDQASAMMKETADACRSAFTGNGILNIKTWPELRKLLDRAACDLEAAASIICHNIEIPGTARSLPEWHEDIGPVVWWRLCRDERPDEASWIGTPLDDDWPGYHTHWTPHPPIPVLKP